MKYNSPHSTAAWGTMAKDWEQGIDYDRLSQGAAEARAGGDPPRRPRRRAGFNFDNIRYVTGTHIGEWARDKFFRYALCPAEGKPFLWDPAPPAKRISSPWIADNVAAPITTMQGAIPPSMNVQHDFAKQIKKALVQLRHRQGAARHRHDGNRRCCARWRRKASRWSTASRRCSTRARSRPPTRSSCSRWPASMVDATYVDIARAIRPGTKENELVAIANDRLFRMGSERVECVNSVSGRRGRPHSHTFSDRMIQPGDMIFLDIMHSYNGYRTCYYRTFICGEPNKHQIDAYETASKWISASIDMIRPGVTPDEVASVWPDAQEFGYRDEAEAFLLQYGHGVGLSLWERPIFSKRFRGQNRRWRKAWCSRWRPGRARRTARAPRASRKRSS